MSFDTELDPGDGGAAEGAPPPPPPSPPPAAPDYTPHQDAPHGIQILTPEQFHMLPDSYSRAEPNASGGMDVWGPPTWTPPSELAPVAQPYGGGTGLTDQNGNVPFTGPAPVDTTLVPPPADELRNAQRYQQVLAGLAEPWAVAPVEGSPEAARYVSPMARLSWDQFRAQYPNVGAPPVAPMYGQIPEFAAAIKASMPAIPPDVLANNPQLARAVAAAYSAALASPVTPDDYSSWLAGKLAGAFAPHPAPTDKMTRIVREAMGKVQAPFQWFGENIADPLLGGAGLTLQALAAQPLTVQSFVDQPVGAVVGAVLRAAGGNDVTGLHPNTTYQSLVWAANRRAELMREAGNPQDPISQARIDGQVAGEVWRGIAPTPRDGWLTSPEAQLEARKNSPQGLAEPFGGAKGAAEMLNPAWMALGPLAKGAGALTRVLPYGEHAAPLIESYIANAGLPGMDHVLGAAFSAGLRSAKVGAGALRESFAGLDSSIGSRLNPGAQMNPGNRQLYDAAYQRRLNEGADTYAADQAARAAANGTTTLDLPGEKGGLSRVTDRFIYKFANDERGTLGFPDNNPGIISNVRDTAASLANPGQTHEFNYKLVDANDLILSHHPNGVANAAYPAGVQPRARERVASQSQVDTIARNLDPNLLLSGGQIDRGTPIVGPGSNVVESGNGRGAGVIKAITDYTDRYNAYRADLERRASEFGFTPEMVRGMQHPILVRERIGTTADSPKFAAEANYRSSLDMSPSEKAIQDAGRVHDRILSSLSIGENQSIDQALLSSENAHLRSAILSGIPETERASLADAQGNLNRDGLERIKAALFAKTFPGPEGQQLLNRFRESIDPSMKNIEAALFRSLPSVAKAEGLVRGAQRPADMALGQDLAAAVNELERIKATPGANVGTEIAQLRSPALFAGEQTITPAQTRLIEILDRLANKPKQLTDFLRRYAELVDEHGAQATLMGGVASRDDLIEQALAHASPKEAQMGLGLEGGTEGQATSVGAKVTLGGKAAEPYRNPTNEELKAAGLPGRPESATAHVDDIMAHDDSTYAGTRFGDINEQVESDLQDHFSTIQDLEDQIANDELKGKRLEKAQKEIERRQGEYDSTLAEVEMAFGKEAADSLRSRVEGSAYDEAIAGDPLEEANAEAIAGSQASGEPRERKPWEAAGERPDSWKAHVEPATGMTEDQMVRELASSDNQQPYTDREIAVERALDAHRMEQVHAKGLEIHGGGDGYYYITKAGESPSFREGGEDNYVGSFSDRGDAIDYALSQPFDPSIDPYPGWGGRQSRALPGTPMEAEFEVGTRTHEAMRAADAEHTQRMADFQREQQERFTSAGGKIETVDEPTIESFSEKNAAQSIMEKGSVKPVTYDGKPYAVVGGAGGPLGREVQMLRLYTPEEWGDRPSYTYSEKGKLEKDGRGFYEGITVKAGKKQYVLGGEDTRVMLHAPRAKGTPPVGTETPKAPTHYGAAPPGTPRAEIGSEVSYTTPKGVAGIGRVTGVSEAKGERLLKVQHEGGNTAIVSEADLHYVKPPEAQAGATASTAAAPKVTLATPSEARAAAPKASTPMKAAAPAKAVAPEVVAKDELAGAMVDHHRIDMALAALPQERTSGTAHQVLAATVRKALAGPSAKAITGDVLAQTDGIREALGIALKQARLPSNRTNRVALADALIEREQAAIAAAKESGAVQAKAEAILSRKPTPEERAVSGGLTSSAFQGVDIAKLTDEVLKPSGFNSVQAFAKTLREGGDVSAVPEGVRDLFSLGHKERGLIKEGWTEEAAKAEIALERERIAKALGVDKAGPATETPKPPIGAEPPSSRVAAAKGIEPPPTGTLSPEAQRAQDTLHAAEDAYAAKYHTEGTPIDEAARTRDTFELDRLRQNADRLARTPSTEAASPTVEPPVPEGHTRLYRGQSTDYPEPTSEAADRGRNFTTDRRAAEAWASHKDVPGVVHYIDVPNEQMASLHHHEGPGGSETAYTVTPEMANTKKLLGAPRPFTPPTEEPVEELARQQGLTRSTTDPGMWEDSRGALFTDEAVRAGTPHSFYGKPVDTTARPVGDENVPPPPNVEAAGKEIAAGIQRVAPADAYAKLAQEMRDGGATETEIKGFLGSNYVPPSRGSAAPPPPRGPRDTATAATPPGGEGPRPNTAPPVGAGLVHEDIQPNRIVQAIDLAKSNALSDPFAAIGRHTVQYAIGHPGSWLDTVATFMRAVKGIGRDDAGAWQSLAALKYDETMRASDDFKWLEQHGMNFWDAKGSRASEHNDQWNSALAERFPWIRIGHQDYATAVNSIMLNVGNDYRRALEKAGMLTDESARTMTDLINHSVGSSHVPAGEDFRLAQRAMEQLIAARTAREHGLTFDAATRTYRDLGGRELSSTQLASQGANAKERLSMNVLAGAEAAMKVIRRVLVSPRYTVSRFQTVGDTLRGLSTMVPGATSLEVGPMHAVSRESARALQMHAVDMAKWYGAWLGFAQVLSMAGLADTSLDPRSSDFGSIRLKNGVRFDPFEGTFGTARLIAQSTFGQVDKNGKMIVPGQPGYLTPEERTADYLTHRLSPVAGVLSDLAARSSFGYKGFDIPSEALNLVTPGIAPRDIIQAVREGLSVGDTLWIAAFNTAGLNASKTGVKPRAPIGPNELVGAGREGLRRIGITFPESAPGKSAPGTGVSGWQ